MIPKKKRADKKTLDRVFRAGKFLSTPLLSFKYTHTDGGGTRISFVVPKTTARLAAKRNRLRRRGYDALKPHLKLIPEDVQGVFIFKKYDDDTERIGKEIEKIAGRVGV